MLDFSLFAPGAGAAPAPVGRASSRPGATQADVPSFGDALASLSAETVAASGSGDGDAAAPLEGSKDGAPGDAGASGADPAAEPDDTGTDTLFFLTGVQPDNDAGWTAFYDNGIDGAHDTAEFESDRPAAPGAEPVEPTDTPDASFTGTATVAAGVLPTALTLPTAPELPVESETSNLDVTSQDTDLPAFRTSDVGLDNTSARPHALANPARVGAPIERSATGEPVAHDDDSRVGRMTTTPQQATARHDGPAVAPVTGFEEAAPNKAGEATTVRSSAPAPVQDAGRTRTHGGGQTPAPGAPRTPGTNAPQTPAADVAQISTHDPALPAEIADVLEAGKQGGPRLGTDTVARIAARLRAAVARNDANANQHADDGRVAQVQPRVRLDVEPHIQSVAPAIELPATQATTSSASTFPIATITSDALRPGTDAGDMSSGSGGYGQLAAPRPMVTLATPAVAGMTTLMQAAVSEGLPADTATQVVQALRVQIARDGGEAHIRLDPRQFGDVTIRVRVDQGQVTARVEADAPVVREWLQSNQHVLRQSLAGQQLTLDRLEVREPSESSDRESTDDTSRRREQPDEERQRRRRQDTGEIFDIVA